MTANVLPGDREACREAGMQDFLAKPIDIDHLCRILCNLEPVSGTEEATPGVAADGDIDYERLDMIRATPNDGDESLLAWVIDTFLADAAERLPRMRAAVEHRDWNGFSEEAHRFYSSASNLGLIRISNVCMQMEIEAVNPEVNKSELLDELTEAWERVLPELERQKTLHD
jgi:HPt (histidine-containing phosphotransfer) domain-containing protein